MVSNNKKWFRTSELSEYLNLSKTQIHILKNKGILPFTKLAGTLYFDREKIDKMLTDQIEKS